MIGSGNTSLVFFFVVFILFPLVSTFQIGETCRFNGVYKNSKNCCCQPDVTKTLQIGRSKTKRDVVAEPKVTDKLCPLCKNGLAEVCCNAPKTRTKTLYLSSSNQLRATTSTSKAKVTTGYGTTTRKSSSKPSTSSSKKSFKAGISKLSLTTITTTRSGTRKTKVTTAGVSPKSKLVLTAPPNIVKCNTKPSTGFVPLVWSNRVKVNLNLYVPNNAIMPWSCLVNQPLTVTLLYANSSTFSFSSFNMTSGKTALSFGYVELNGNALEKSKGVVVPTQLSIRVGMPSLSTKVGLPQWQLNQILHPSDEMLVSTLKAGSSFVGKVISSSDIDEGIRKILGMGDGDKVLTWFGNVLGVKNTSYFQKLNQVDISIKDTKASFIVKSQIGATPSFSYGMGINATLILSKGKWKSSSRQYYYQVASSNYTTIWSYGFTNTWTLTSQGICTTRVPSMITLYNLPRTNFTGVKTVEGKLSVNCKTKIPTQVLGLASLMVHSGKNKFNVNMAPPELKVSDWNSIHNGTIAWDSTKDFQMFGAIRSSVMLTSGKLPKARGWGTGHWWFVNRYNPVSYALLSSNIRVVGLHEKAGVALGTLSLIQCGKQGLIEAPCLEHVTKQPNDTNPLTNTWKTLSKTQASKFLGTILLNHVEIKYYPGNIMTLALLDHVRVNQTWKLPSGTSSTWLGYDVFAPSGRVGVINVGLLGHACKGIHRTTFDFRNTSSPLLPNGKRKLSIINTTALVGRGEARFSCQSNEKTLGTLMMIGNLSSTTMIAKLYENSTYMMKKPQVEFYSNHSHLDVKSLHSWGSSLAIHVPLDKNDVIHPKRGSFWHLITPKGGRLNQTLSSLLGRKSAGKFMNSMKNSTSKAFKDFIKNPNKFSNVTLGYQKTLNKTVTHELYHFGRTGYDRLVGKQIHLTQSFSNFTNTNSTNGSSIVGYKPWPKPSLKKTMKLGTPKPNFTATRLNVTLTTVQKYTGSWDFSMLNSTSGLTSTMLRKRGGSSTTSSTTSRSSTTSSKIVSTTSKLSTSSSTISSAPTYSAAQLDSTDLPVSSNDFAYEWTLDNPGNLLVQFTSSYEVCPAAQQSVTGSIENSKIFGEIPQFIGRASFVCTKQGDAVSFASQLASPAMNYTPFTSTLPLNNVSFQVNCVPDSNLCFWPAGASGDALNGLYSFANAMNASSYWNAQNITQMLQDAVYGTTDPQEASQMVQAVLSQYPALQENLKNISGSLPPSFIMADPLAGSLIGQFAFNTPMQSFQCSSDYTKACEYPSIVLAGQINTSSTIDSISSSSNSSFSLMYASVLQSTQQGMETHRQVLATSLGNYGFLAVNLTGDLCDETSIGQVIWEISGFPGLSIVNLLPGMASSTEGMIKLDCSLLDEGVIDWEFHDGSFPALNMAFDMFGSSTTISQSNANFSYYSVNDTFGVQSKIGNFYFYISFAGTDPSATLHVTTWGSNVTLGGMLSTETSGSQSTFVQLFGKILNGQTFKSFNLNTLSTSFYVDYNAETYQAAAQVNLQSVYNQVLIDSWVEVNLSFSGGDYKVVSDFANIVLYFGESQDNFMNLSSSYVPCSNGSSVNGGFTSSADFSFLLPAGVGQVSGESNVTFSCSGTSFSNLVANGYLQGPLQLNLFNDSVQVDAANFSFSHNFLEVFFVTTNSQLTGQFDFSQEGAMVEAVFINAPGPITPLNSSLPYSTYWNQILDGLNVDVSLENFYLNYAYNQNPPHMTIQGDLNVGPLQVSVDISFLQSNSAWYVKFFNVSLVLGEVGTVILTGANNLCMEDEASTFQGLIVLNALGPLKQTTLMATIDVMCMEGNVSYYTVTGMANNIPLSFLGSTSNANLNLQFNSSDSALFINMTGGNWIGSMSLNVTSKVYQFDFSSMGKIAFGGLPFGSGLTGALVTTSASSVTSLTVESFMLTSINQAFNFTCVVAVSSSGYTVGEALYVEMVESNNVWQLKNSDFTFSGAFNIASYGQAIINGQLTCPESSLSSSVTLNGMKEFGQISSNGVVDYDCETRVWNMTVNLQELQVVALGEQLTFTNVVLSYANDSKVLNLQGTVTFGTLQGIVQLVYNMNQSNILDHLSLQVMSGVGLFDEDLPFGDDFAGAVSASPNDLISPTALLSEATFVWNYTPNTFSINAAIQDGSFSGLLNLNLLNEGNNTWSVQEALVYVGIQGYGSLTLTGNTPCDSGLTVVSDLNLPVVGPQQLEGSVEFLCNGTSIESYVATLTDAMTFSLFGETQEASATIVYDSAQGDLSVMAMVEPNITMSVYYLEGNYQFVMQVNTPTGWANMPFNGPIGNWVDSADTTTTPPTSSPMQFAQLNYTSWNKTDSLNFTCTLIDTVDSSSGLLQVITDFVGNGSSTNWTLVNGVALVTIMVDNMAQLTLQLAPECSNGIGPRLG